MVKNRNGVAKLCPNGLTRAANLRVVHVTKNGIINTRRTLYTQTSYRTILSQGHLH